MLNIAKMVNKSFHSSSKEEKVVLNILIANAKPAVFEPTDKKATTGVGEPSYRQESIDEREQQQF